MHDAREDRAGGGLVHAGQLLHRLRRERDLVAGDVVGEWVNLDGTRMSVPRFAAGVPDKTATGAVGAMSLWAGESVSAVKRVQPAREIVRELAQEAERLLRRSH